MFCPKCGSKIPDGGKFCSVCGAKLEEGTAQSPKGSSNSTKTVLIVVGIIAAVLILVFAGAVILFKKVVKNYMADTSAVEEQVEEYTEIYEDEDESADEEDTDEAAGNDEFSGDIKSLSRKELLPYSGDESEVASITPSVNNIPIADDMSNVINIDEYEYHDKAMLDKLKNNGFVVAYDAGREF
ncbi:MAG: zinc-ribbon domain-containing protein, partial [Lachnospiraceae bacterium]|nr:zinc-ribbon domain-containing protein [Lachnospiraceae bacterium]